MPIYTKRGDYGKTDLYTGGRVKKTDPRIAAIGDVDELNAAIGEAIAFAINSNLQPLNSKKILINIQKDLFVLGADLATPKRRTHKGAPDVPRIMEKHVTKLEHIIDKLKTLLPPLKNFILPGGTLLAAQLFFARAVCRRAERSIVKIQGLTSISRLNLVYLNRLSDLLFMLGRYTNFLAHKKETKWP